mgnify:CR=1 FL=1
MSEILMPKATAVWLLDNTTLTFTQISAFCGLHHLEVKGIADGDVAENMRGVDPIAGGILSREEIARGEENADYVLKIAASKIAHIPQPPRKGSRYTPVIRRQDKPDAVAWFIRNHPEVSDAGPVHTDRTGRGDCQVGRQASPHRSGKKPEYRGPRSATHPG